MNNLKKMGKLLSILRQPIFTTILVLIKSIYMNAIEAIKKIKLALGLQKFAEQKKLADGTLVEANPDFELGAQLSVVSEDGTLAPAPEGEHTLESGTKILVDAAGVIVEITDPASEDLEEHEDKVEEEMAKKEKMEETPAEEVKEEVSEMIAEELISAIVEAIQPMVQEMAKMKEEVVEMKKKFAQFSAEPAAKPVKNNFSAQSATTNTKLEMIAELRKSTKQNKK
jgi:hypothetical protein